MLFGRDRDDPSPGLEWERDGPWRAHTDVSRRETVDYDSATYLCRVRDSDDGAWSVAYGTPTDDGSSRVFLFRADTLEWTTPVDHPTAGFVSDDGTVAVLQGGAHDGLDGGIRAFDASGTRLLAWEFDANISDGDLSTDGQFAVVRTNPPDDTTYVFDLEAGDLRTTHESSWATPSYVRLYPSDRTWYAYLGNSLEKKPLYAIDPDGTLVWESSSYRKMKPLTVRLKSRLAN